MRLGKAIAAAIIAHAAIADAHHSPIAIVTGTYVGNDASNRQMATGFKPSLVVITSTDGTSGDEVTLMVKGRSIYSQGSNTTDILTTCYMHATDGFVVGDIYTNKLASNYEYTAISE